MTRAAKDVHTLALWQKLHEPERGQLWAGALAELVAAEDASLPCYIIAQLSAPELSVYARNALIFAAEEIAWPHRQERKAVQELLLKYAITIRDTADCGTESEQALYAAIRRYATLVPAEEADGLLEFMRPEDNLLTRYSALFAVHAIFSVAAVFPCEATRKLQSHVHDIADQILSASPSTGEQRALALTALHAAAALVDPELPSLVLKLKSLQRPYLNRRAVDLLVRLDSLWHRADRSALSKEACAMFVKCGELLLSKGT